MLRQRFLVLVPDLVDPALVTIKWSAEVGAQDLKSVLPNAFAQVSILGTKLVGELFT